MCPTDPLINIQKGQPKLPNTEFEICEIANRKIQLDNTIHISNSPEKAKRINRRNETQPDHYFFQHNPPELIQQIQSEELRESNVFYNIGVRRNAAYFQNLCKD